ncbi:MAG: hypothetical protein Q9217_001839 [Psora testacea]
MAVDTSSQLSFPFPLVPISEGMESDKSHPSSITQLDGKVSGLTANDFKPSKRLYVAFLTLAVITLMIISQKLKGTAIEAFWSGTSFLLCSAVFQPNIASFSHIFGRKPMVYTALVFFLIGTMVAAVADGFTTLLVGRSIQGVGGGGLIALTNILVTDLVPLRVRENVNWRWIFYINFPFIGLAFPFVFFFLRLDFKATQLREQLRRIDWIGSILFVGSTTSFLIPISWGGVFYSWSSWRTLVPLFVGLAGLTSFIAYEVWVARETLIRFGVFRNRTAAAAYFETVLHGMILWCLLFYLPLYYEAVKDESPILAGVSLFPQTFTVAPAAVVTGIAITKTGRYRFAIWAGWIFTILGTGLLYLLHVHTKTAQWVFLNVVSGLGMGMLFPSMSFAIQAASKDEDLAFAVAMFSFLRAFGQSIGVAVGGTIFQNEMKKKLLGYPSLAPMAVQYSQDAASLVQVIRTLPGDQNEEKQELVQAYADALKVVWVSMCGLAALAGLSSFLIKGLNMDRPLQTEQGFQEPTRIEAGKREGRV